VDVPFDVIGVLFRRGFGASSAGTVAFSFIHTNDMPVFFAGFLAILLHFSGFLFAAKCVKRRTESDRTLTIKSRLFSCESP
jgi:hypothetical protein